MYITTIFQQQYRIEKIEQRISVLDAVDRKVINRSIKIRDGSSKGTPG